MQRFVYYLEDASDAIASLDGSREHRFRATAESFLDAPRSAFAKRLSPNVRQIKHRGSKTRTFSTWCHDEVREILVIHIVYRKRNEDAFFEKLHKYDEEGKQFIDRFRELTDDEFEAWRRSAQNRNEVILVGT
jgi:hypothetical protein